MKQSILMISASYSFYAVVVDNAANIHKQYLLHNSDSSVVITAKELEGAHNNQRQEPQQQPPNLENISNCRVYHTL